MTPPPKTARNAASDKQKAKRVHTLAAAGERGRALAAATTSKLAPRTAETFAKTKALFEETVIDLATSDIMTEAPGEELRQELKEEIARLLTRPPRLSSPGLLGCRLEHLATCKEDPSSFDLLCEAIVRITLGNIPWGNLRCPPHM